MIDDALRDPVAGVGKPEPLRHLLAGVWSRRISEERRLVHDLDGAGPGVPLGWPVAVCES
ncbi:MAG: type II toxin-antitoxin system YoeB family toxin [Nocardioidaceae bacterium]